MSGREREAVEKLFKRYDTENKGEITKLQLRACLCDMNGRKIDDIELNLICDLMEISKSGMIGLEGFTNVFLRFFKYC